MLRRWGWNVMYTSLALLAGCVEPYEVPNILEDVNILVVDGFVNTTDNSATVTLTSALPLDSISPPVPELQATVSIEDNEGHKFLLAESGEGRYGVTETSFDKSKEYRVHIFTAKDKEYTSDYIKLLDTPEIDSVTWIPAETGINIRVNTHDPENNSHYYYWNWEETWEYTTPFISNYKMVDGEAFPRPYNEQIWTCWDSDKSTDILVGTSNRLSADVIRDFPVAFVPGDSRKLSRRYSILVKQRTLTAEAYDFWSLLQKTSEQLGGLFDTQPAQVLGNIHATNGNEPVLGYFSGGEVTEKRLFVGFSSLPNYLLAMRVRAYCDNDDIGSLMLSQLPSTPNSLLLIDAIVVRGAGLIGYTWAPSICIDCRLLGGKTARPAYWP